MSLPTARILVLTAAAAAPLALLAPAVANAAPTHDPTVKRDGYINVMDGVSISTNGETYCTVDPSSTDSHTRLHCGTVTRNLIGNAVHVLVTDDNHPGAAIPTEVSVSASQNLVEVTRQDFAFVEQSRREVDGSGYEFNGKGIKYADTDGWAFGIDSRMLGYPADVTIDLYQGPQAG